jgi:fatty-acyl-CoA synthase
MQGLMQDVPLTLDLLLTRARELGGSVEVVSAHGEELERTTWRAVAERVHRLANALDRLGVARGARVGTFAWNSRRHLELYLAVPCSGRVLHTVNVRLFADDVAYVIEHAGDEVIFVDASLTPALAAVRDRLSVREYVVMDDGGEVHEAFADAPRYEDLLGAESADYETPPLAEGDAASVCFTSGTTGRPKGVVYSHRSVVLHTIALLMRDAHAISRTDCVLPFTPMFHVNCWGLPYACAFAPAKLVLTGHDVSAEAGARLIESERVTVAAGVPTVWIRMASQLEGGERDFGSLKRVLCGGSEASVTLIDRYRRRGISFFHAWGSTEMSPSGTAGWVGPDDDAESERWGPPEPLVQLRLVDDAGDLVPWDGSAAGEIEARGPWIAAAYLSPDDDSNATRFSPDGWFRSGDIANITPEGRVRIVDRAKDLIKSGGEWISSNELESALASHPAVGEVAVIAVADAEWDERPAALVVPAAGAEVRAEELLDHLRERVARWWLPDIVEVVEELPKTGVGKYNKRLIRQEHGERLARELANRKKEHA